ncbi:MAG: 1-phosphofructokinase family hexose kinase [Ancrocorticia sp.]|jgi:1-phosphofructokinase family hexose kinase|nr:1-phosphofructokinase family hexose kinase [Ancrocorticia sp.]MCI1896512.1 1-phosphofructokinase family hexose kinase [Ancrocorticia sp.]MCI1933181.1 1-phosphofructokinase family hexose kinase [Ancrocorticia sp.]MCI1963836.1 1-phosphofructokinase family hexose kinase [Ancrocorticia sp.]MCI2002174.1 1-phosphofructokinase family hexose kinase [Ancrocorticia sp.]
MIVTLTANPSIDRTVTLSGKLVPGGVHRIVEDRTQPGGKGINVALGVHRAGLPVSAVFQARSDDPLVNLLKKAELPYRNSPVSGPVRTNLTIVGGNVTTKINEPGTQLTAAECEALEEALMAAISPTDTIMLSGSLAPGFPADEYARLVRRIRPVGAWIGVDTSDEPLAALAEHLGDSAPDFVKPNADELGQLTGHDGGAIEDAVTRGDFSEIHDAVQWLRSRGVSEVLVTLGGAGAVLATAEGTWYAPSPNVRVVSTVGAGDSATAGYIIARAAKRDAPERLALATAYGAAAVSMPGTTIPSPQDVHPDFAAVRSI